MVEMKVRGLAVDANSRSPVVILTDMGETRFLPIWIGVFEAEAILLALEKIQVPRPTSHDLMKNLVEILGGTLEKVVVHNLDEKTSTYYAKLIIRVEGKADTIEVDARPSDSVALALRLGAPVFVTEDILSQPSVVKDKAKVEREIEDFKKFIQEVKPSDFEKWEREHPHTPGEDSGESDKPNS